MKTGEIYPQLPPMKADVFLKFFIRADLRHLRLNKPDTALWQILEWSGYPNWST